MQNDFRRVPRRIYSRDSHEILPLKWIEVHSCWYFISDAKYCWTSSVISPTATTTTTTRQPNPPPISGINAESHCPISIACTITP